MILYDLEEFFLCYAMDLPTQTCVWCEIIGNGFESYAVWLRPLRFRPSPELQWSDKAYDLMRVSEQSDGHVVVFVVWDDAKVMAIGP